MKTVLFSGIAATAMLIATPGAVASDSWSQSSPSAADAMQQTANGRKAGGNMGMPGMGMPKPSMPHVGGMPHMGGMKPGGHQAGFHPRPGFHGIPRTDVYRRPHRGFILPRYWVQPTFYLSNFGSYGLSAPSNGYYWSRYYDDAVLTDNRGYVQDYRSDIAWNEGPDRTSDYREPEYGPSMRPDANAYNWNDNGDVAFAAPDGSSYSYDGEWDGEYVDPQGRVFEGEWEGTVTRHDGVKGAGYPAPAPNHAVPSSAPHHSGAPYPEPDYDDARYDVPRGYENYERCLKSNGLKGAAIGALLGGVAGNRIAGRGNRTGGTLVGAGIGGLLGVAVEKASSKCSHHRPRAPHPQATYPYPHPQPSYGTGWQGGYYYYPQPVVTTITMAPVTTTTTTVTEEVYYETVKTYRKPAVRKWKPKPKPRCTCR
jgi:Ni/Co efflux regulator RcnB